MVSAKSFDSTVCFRAGLALGACETEAEIEPLLADTSLTLGFEQVRFAAYFPSMGRILTLGTFPAAWHERYEAAEYIHHDPVVSHCLINSSALFWHDLKLGSGKRSSLQRQIMKEAAEFGLVDGISLPVHGAGAELGALSLASSSRIPALERVQVDGLRFLACSVHAALKRAVALAGNPAGAFALLTARERECLRWTAEGKTAWEISRILDLAESTVTFHLKNAIAKMDVNNRSQAVAKAIAQSQITFF